MMDRSTSLTDQSMGVVSYWTANFTTQVCKECVIDSEDIITRIHISIRHRKRDDIEEKTSKQVNIDALIQQRNTELPNNPHRTWARRSLRIPEMILTASFIVSRSASRSVRR